MKLLENLLKDRNWHNFKVAEIKLVYVPFWKTSYIAFFEKVSDGQKIVSRTVSSKRALDNQLRFDDELLFLLGSSAVEKKPAHAYPFEVVKAHIPENDAKKIVQIKLAEMLMLGKDNVIVSELEKFYFPKWVAFLEVAEGTYRIEVNAVNGKIFGREKVPLREKGWLEITSETLNELKEPEAWARYASEIASGTSSKIVSAGFWKTF